MSNTPTPEREETMSEPITFTDDAERQFWEQVFRDAYRNTSAGSESMYADIAVLERRKRIGTKPALKAEKWTLAEILPPEVMRLLEVDTKYLDDTHRRLAFDGYNARASAVEEVAEHIRSARKVLGLDAKEVKP
jgi:hypothetical protein